MHLKQIYRFYKNCTISSFYKDYQNRQQIVNGLRQKASIVSAQCDTLLVLEDILVEYVIDNPQDLNISIENLHEYFNNTEDYHEEIDFEDLSAKNINLLVKSYNLRTIANIFDHYMYFKMMVNKIKNDVLDPSVDVDYFKKDVVTVGDVIKFVMNMPLAFKVIDGLL